MRPRKFGKSARIKVWYLRKLKKLKFVEISKQIGCSTSQAQRMYAEGVFK